MRALALAVVIAIAVVASGGCNRRAYKGWTMSFGPRDGHAAVDADGVTLVFEGIPMTLPPGQSGGGSGGSLQLAGGGTSQVGLFALGQTLTASYRDGVNTLTLDRYTVRIVDEGRAAKVGDKQFDLTGGKKTIVIARDGNATIR